jgi:hypothetical protein
MLAINKSTEMKIQPFSILINTSDGYQDCWEPFFKLLKKFWPGCNAPIYLNTGKVTWSCAEFPGLICICTEKDVYKKMSWSECLLHALGAIDTPLVLYFQEDYFLDKQVRSEIVNRAASYMLDNPWVDNISLTRHCSPGPYTNHQEDWLQIISPKARYRISTQASLWRVEALKRYLDPIENGWMFEIFGTWRAQKRSGLFLSTKWDDDSGGPAINYLHTGIIKGKWLPKITEVFLNNLIEIDFSKRGFYQPKPFILHKYDVLKKLTENPLHMLNQWLRK